MPHAGGLYDQPLADIIEMETVNFAYKAFSAFYRASRDNRFIEWSEQFPDLAQFVADHRSDV